MNAADKAAAEQGIRPLLTGYAHDMADGMRGCGANKDVQEAMLALNQVTAPF